MTLLAAIGAWTGSLGSVEALEALDEARVPAGPIYSVADMMIDPHFIARGLFEEVEVNGKPLKIPALLPKLTGTPGKTRWPGPAVGAHNEEVLREGLGLADSDWEALRHSGVISDS